MITGKTKLLGIIGDPVEHSLSPVMHNAAIAHLDLDYVYVPFHVKPEDLERAIAGFEAIGLVGFNVTIPHKQAILPMLSEIEPEAEMVGAANTIWRTETGWRGTNTDVKGFIAPLEEKSRDWNNIAPVILGNGGAARAVVVGCHQLGCQEIHVIGRDREKLKKFKQSWQNTPLEEAIIIHSKEEELSEMVSKAKLLVNATPIGMSSHVNKSPVEPFVMKTLPKDAIAYDLIYNPSPTEFLKLAKQQGVEAIDGVEMLVQQGATALEIWLNCPVPVDIMRESLLQQLRLR